MVRTDDNLIWSDNPGMEISGRPTASVEENFFAIFKSTVTPKKGTSGKPTDKVLYWGVQFSVVKGKIVDGKAKNTYKPVATRISKEQYDELIEKYRR